MSTSVHRSRGSAYPAVLLLWTLLLSIWTLPVQAELAANALFSSGYVTATAPAASARELAKGDDIFGGDRVDTAENGRVQMRFTDGGLVSLMPNSTFSVDEYFHEDGTDDDASLVFGLLRGGLRTITGTIGKVQHDQYELKTPVATLGIRGTEYVAVIRPANTLRVHVGRGKVVITNEQGSLEVPEGRNAIVTLGSAPEFSDQSPQYQATGPMGDRLVATYQHHQDPRLLNPRDDMPPPGRHSFIDLPAGNGAPGSSTPPTVPTPTPPTPEPEPEPEPGPEPTPEPIPTPPTPEPIPTPPTPEPPTPEPEPEPPLTPEPPPTPPISTSYFMAGTVPFIPGFSNDGPWLSGPDGLDASFDEGGHITSFDLGALNTGTWQQSNVGTSGALSWGAFTDGTGSLGAGSIVLNDEQYLPYVIGSVPVDALPAGTLNYSLEGTPAVFATNTDGTFAVGGQLQKFDMGINIADMHFALDMGLTVNLDTGPLTPSVHYSSNSNGQLSSADAQGRGFSFSSPVSGGSDCSNDCSMDVHGFLAGSDASQAGVTYRIHDQHGGNYIFGAAGLKQ